MRSSDATGSDVSTTGARRRSRSAPYSITPFSIRKNAADCADANTVRSESWNSRPSRPAGTVPTTSSQPSLASWLSGAIWRSTSERHMPAKIRIQSWKKKMNRTMAVARWVAIKNVMKYGSFWWMFQPSSCGRITLWPRLEIGNSSENPCSSPSTIAWK